MEEHWGKVLNMRVDSLAVEIKNVAVGDLMSIKQSILKREIGLELLMNIYFHPDYTILDHAIELEYSESYLRKTITKINELLAVVNASIDYLKEGTDSKPVIVAKNEIELMHMITNIYLVSDYASIRPFKKVQPSVFSGYIKRLNLQVTGPMRNYLQTLAFITDIRYSQGIITREKMKRAYDYIIDQYKLHDFISIFQCSIDNELGTYFGSSYIAQNQSDFKAMSDVLIALLLKIIVAGSSVDNVLNRFQLFHHNFSLQHPTAFTIFNKSLARYTQLIDMDLEPYYGEIIYNLYIHLPNIRPHVGMRLGVYSDFGVDHAYSLMQIIKRHFQNHQIEVFREGEDYDYVCTTDTMTDRLSDYDIIPMSDLIGCSDIQMIYHTLYTEARLSKDPLVSQLEDYLS